MTEPMQTNVLYYGDNLDILRRYLPDASVDLIYLDPPFNSNRDYNVIFRDESGNSSDAQLLAFEDTWHWGPSAESTYRYLTNTAHHAGPVPDEVSTIIAALRRHWLEPDDARGVDPDRRGVPILGTIDLMEAVVKDHAIFDIQAAPDLRKPAALRGEDDALRPAIAPLKLSDRWDPTADAILHTGSCEQLMASMPDGAASLIVTSPPYNIGKSYETRTSLGVYLESQRRVIGEAVRLLADGGSIAWQVGNHIDRGEVVPLDTVLYPMFKELGLKLRNRIVWHFEHGLHASKRFSGRYETILWFTKGDDYFFDLDAVRVPQKYPNKKAFKGPNRGQLTGNPLGKNPGDLWIIPNVKWNHIEKTEHPCQFPIELIERLVLPLTRPGELVLDPYGGVGSAVLAAVLHGRRGAMAEIVPAYVETASNRLNLAEQGLLRARPISRSVYQPPER